MKQFKDMKAINRAIDSVVSKVSNETLQEILVNVCFQALVNKNWDPKRIMAIRESNISKDFKGAVAKHMPVSFDKEEQVYKFDHKKVTSILSKLGFEGDVSITFEEFVGNFPLFYNKDESKKTGDSLEKLQKNIASRLTGLNIERASDIASIMATLAKYPSVLDNVAEMVLNIKPSETKADSE